MSPEAPRTWLALGVALGILVGGALVWTLRARTPRLETPKEHPRIFDAALPANPEPPRTALVTKLEPGRKDAAPEAAPGRVAEKKRARAAFRRVARECGNQVLEKPTFGNLKFSYDLLVEGGQARASNVALVQASFGDPALESCILTAVAKVRWPAVKEEVQKGLEAIVRIADFNP